jgi:activator of HSP90 ATPase
MKPAIPVAVPEPARRQIMASIAVALGGLAVSSPFRLRAQQPVMRQKSAMTANQACMSLHDDIVFEASPQRIYEALLDAKQFAVFSGQPAEISPMPGGAFSLFGGQIVGRHIELIADRRIVQAWRPTHWDEGVYSLVRFELKARGSASTLVFDHTGFPAGEFDHLDWGWRHHYWEPLQKFLT